MIYFDHTAFHPVLPSVMSKTNELMRKLANPSSLHKAGAAMKKEIEEARANVATAIGCDPSEIIFTSGATESNQVMAFGPILDLESTKFTSYVSEFEHSSIEECGATEPISHQISDKEGYVYDSHILVDNETGTNFEDWVSFHALSSDITAAVGNIPVNVKRLNLQAASFSGEKIGGFSGSGVLYVSNDYKYIYEPMITGHQERGRRGGTENVLGIVAIGVAIKEAMDNMSAKNLHCKTLKDTLLKELNRHKFDYIVNGEHQIPAICSVSFKGIDGSALATYLDAHDICVSTGSACNSGSMEPSKVLTAFGVPSEYINGTIRFSFGIQNTVAEIKHTVNIIKDFMEMQK